MKSASQASFRAAAEVPDRDDPPPEAKKRRTQDQIHRERLTERIRDLEARRDAAVHEAVTAVRENAETELKERIAKTAARVAARFADRIEVQRKMLAALGEKAAG